MKGSNIRGSLQKAPAPRPRSVVLFESGDRIHHRQTLKQERRSSGVCHGGKNHLDNREPKVKDNPQNEARPSSPKDNRSEENSTSDSSAKQASTVQYLLSSQGLVVAPEAETWAFGAGQERAVGPQEIVRSFYRCQAYSRSVFDMAWKVEGDFFENCSCIFGSCRCIYHSFPPLCEAGIAWHIERGEFGDVRLDALNVVAVFRASGAPIVGDMALYVDDRASPQQSEALGKIFTCQKGGQLALIAPFVGKVLGTRRVPIEYRVQGKVRSVSVPQTLEIVIDPAKGGNVKEGPYLAEPPNCWLTHRPLYLVSSRKGTYTDYGRRWDSTGKTGYYGKFSYSG
jgi:hypothetical protein